MLMLTGYAANGLSALDITADWETLVSTDGSVLTARHESAAVVVGDSVYLLGGRGNRPVERFTPGTGQWDNLGLAPLELNHIQPVAVDHEIVVIGAFTGPYPREDTVAEIHVFDTKTGEWRINGSMPESRRRGSTATVAAKGKIYVLGGNTQGHDGGAVPWFDEYDPATGEWRELPDAPNARDHFSAVVIGDLLIAAGGRQTAMPNPAANPVTTTDIYHFSTGQWREAPPIPTARAGAITVRYGNDMLVAGGEINTDSLALNTVESFDAETGQWQSLPAMKRGRHSGGGVIIDQRFYVFTGAPTIGGASELPDSEWLSLPALAEGSATGGDASASGSETSVRKKSGASGVWMLAVFLLAVLNRRRLQV